MAAADSIAQGASRPDDLPGPFGLSWMAAVCVSLVLFILSRASAQGAVSIDDIGCWLAGLMPFALQLFGQRVFSWRSTTYLEIWILSLGIYLTLQIFGSAHFVEYPLNLRVDVGLARNFVSSCIYVGFASLLWFAISKVFARPRIRFVTFAFSALLVCGTLAIILFYPFLSEA
jgi:hypothetical protein